MTLARIATLLLLVAFSVMTLFPLYWMVMTAIMPTSDILSRSPPLVPDPAKLQFGAFVDIFYARPFLSWMLNSILVASMSTLVALFVSTLAGYSLSRFGGRPQQAVGGALLISKLVPAGLILIPLFIVYNAVGLFDTLPGLVAAHLTIGVPLATWLMKAFFDRIPQDLEQAAMIDGASPLQALRLIILPLAKPGMAATTVYLVLTSWGEFIFARTLLDDPSHHLLTVGMQSFVGQQEISWALLMAAGSVSVLPAVLLFIFLEPFLVSGMTKGALAGT